MSNKMYWQHAKEYDEAVRDNLYNSLYERPSLLSMLPPLEGLSVLDMGCGSGVYAEELLERGAEVTAVDLSIQMISIVKANLGKKVKAYVQNLATGLPHEESHTFDLVISPLVIHYIEDLQRLFAEVARVLKPGGVFIFSTHHPLVDFENSNSGNYFATESVTQLWGTIGEKVEVHFYRRPMTELFKAIEKSGMNVISFNEGAPDRKMKTVSEKTFQRLSTNPVFIFLKCKAGE